MYRTEYVYTDPDTGAAGKMHLHGGQWVGSECVFEFSATTRGLAGVVRVDWRGQSPGVELTDGTMEDPVTRSLLEKIVELMGGLRTGTFDGITDAELAAMYGAEYHSDQGYSINGEFEATRKARMADLVVALTAPKKVLVAGCSAGECIRQLRARGVEAWGFDVCPDIEKVAYPDVREFVRQGSVAAIPFSPEDGFDVLTAFDVFEHVPEGHLPRMVAEMTRLGVRHLVTLIAHCEIQYAGHLTLRPLPWWDAMLAPHFRRIPNHELADPWPAVEDNPDPTKLLRVFAAV